jgi:hypothetical protein
MKLLESPTIQKVYGRGNKEPDTKTQGDTEVKIYDNSSVSPFKQFTKQKTMVEAI